MKDDWWDELLSTHAMDGRRDAERGVHEPPYPSTDDPMEKDENLAYDKGFKQRRRELGDAFQWA